MYTYFLYWLFNTDTDTDTDTAAIMCELGQLQLWIAMIMMTGDVPSEIMGGRPVVMTSILLVLIPNVEQGKFTHWMDKVAQTSGHHNQSLPLAFTTPVIQLWVWRYGVELETL